MPIIERLFAHDVGSTLSIQKTTGDLLKNTGAVVRLPMLLSSLGLIRGKLPPTCHHRGFMSADEIGSPPFSSLDFLLGDGKGA